LRCFDQYRFFNAQSEKQWRAAERPENINDNGHPARILSPGEKPAERKLHVLTQIKKKILDFDAAKHIFQAILRLSIFFFDPSTAGPAPSGFNANHLRLGIKLKK
jgi:hypothetical protein